MEDPIRKFFIIREDVVFEANPFTINLAEAMYKTGKIKQNSMAGLSAENANLEGENYFEPEELLNFDAELFPDNLRFTLDFNKKRMGPFDVDCYLVKLGNEMLFRITLSMYGTDYNTYPFNLGRIQFETNNQYDGVQLVGSDYNGEGECYFAQVYAIRPAKGNMLQNFNQIWTQVETIYTNVINRLIKEIKDNY